MSLGNGNARPATPAGAAARHRVAEAAEAGERLHLACSLSFTFGSSDKFHDSMLVDRWVLVRYGRWGTHGEFAAKEFDTPEKASAYHWGLLRGKVAKGYLVAGAEVTFAESAAEALAAADPYGESSPRRIADNVLTRWAEEQWGPGRARAGRWMPGASAGRGFVPRSPRTPAQGKGLLLGLANPDPEPCVMLECAMAGESEAFLVPLALSHPRCPEEARVARGLLGLAEAF